MNAQSTHHQNKARYAYCILNYRSRGVILMILIGNRIAARSIGEEAMSRKLHFEWEMPDEVFDECFPETAFLQQLKEGAIIKLFRAGRLASGYAASLLGVTRRDFLDLLKQQGIPLVEYTEADLAADLQTLNTLEPRHQSRHVSPPPDN